MSFQSQWHRAAEGAWTWWTLVWWPPPHWSAPRFCSRKKQKWWRDIKRYQKISRDHELIWRSHNSLMIIIIYHIYIYQRIYRSNPSMWWIWMMMNDAIIRSSSMPSHVGANVDVPEGSRSNLAAKAKLSTHSELHRRDLSSGWLRSMVWWYGWLRL